MERRNGYSEQVLLDKDQIRSRLHELADWINEEYKDRNLLVVTVFMGALPTTAALMDNITLPDVQYDGLRVKSYQGQESSKEPELIWDMQSDVSGRDVLIVEDITDTRHTAAFVYDLIRERGAKSVRILTLLDKPDRQEVDLEVHQIGFVIPNKWVEHFGLDTDGFNRSGANITYRVYESSND